MRTYRMPQAMSLTALMLIGLVSPFAFAFGDTMSEGDKCRLREAIGRQNVSELAQQIDAEQGYIKTQLIAEELGRRGGSEAEAVMMHLKDKLTGRIEQHKGKDPFSEMVLATVRIELARLKSSKTKDDYLAQLDQLLSTGNSFVQAATAMELYDIASPEARDLLMKHESRPNISPMVKVERLKMDHWNLDNEMFVCAILRSARAETAKGDTHLVAESTVLSQRGMFEALYPAILEDELRSSSTVSQSYAQFIREGYEGLRVCEERFWPGLSALIDMYKRRDSRASTELEKVYLDENRHWPSRKKAYELFLTLEMERAGLTEPNGQIKYLLWRLESTGDGHSSDWKDNTKTIDAVKNAALVRKLIEYGKPVQPFLEKALLDTSPEDAPRRYEALLYIRKHTNR